MSWFHRLARFQLVSFGLIFALLASSCVAEVPRSDTRSEDVEKCGPCAYPIGVFLVWLIKAIVLGIGGAIGLVLVVDAAGNLVVTWRGGSRRVPKEEYERASKQLSDQDRAVLSEALQSPSDLAARANDDSALTWILAETARKVEPFSECHGFQTTINDNSRNTSVGIDIVAPTHSVAQHICLNIAQSLGFSGGGCNSISTSRDLDKECCKHKGKSLAVMLVAIVDSVTSSFPIFPRWFKDFPPESCMGVGAAM